MFILLGISLTLAFLLIANLASAILASGIWRIASRPTRVLSARARAGIVFCLRVGPVVAALVFVATFTLPAYLLHEPENSGEAISLKLAVIALVSLIAVFLAIFRVFKTWRATRNLVNSWQINSTRIVLTDVDVPVFSIVNTFPVMAIVGITRPRIFVAEQVLRSLSECELKAALAHEYGHLRSRDNLKRTILRVCRDLVIFPIGATLDKAWADSAESAADEYAAKLDRSGALDLASALIKLTRIAPRQIRPNSFAGSFMIDGDSSDVTSRVRSLLRLYEDSDHALRSSPVLAVRSTWVWSAAFAGILALHLTDQRLLVATHTAIESFLWILQ